MLEHHEAVGQELVRQGRLMAPNGGRPRLEQDDPVPRIRPVQVVEQAQRVGVALLPVVEQYESEEGVGPFFGLGRRTLFHEPQAPFLATAESRDVGHQAHRQRQRRHQIAIRADDETGLLPLRIELEHPFLLVVATARHLEARQKPAFHGGHVRRLEAERRPEIVVRVRVARQRFHAILGDL